MSRVALCFLCLAMAACGPQDRPEGTQCATKKSDGTGGRSGTALGLAGGGKAGYSAGDYIPFQARPPSGPVGLSETPHTSTVTVQSANRAFREKLSKLLADKNRETLNLLSISAGGELGAFGAGFLNGLAAREGGAGGLNPAYDVVTGVSTGALIAPLAFSGRDKDLEILKTQYTNITDKDLVSKRSKMGALFSNSLYRTEKLRKRIKEVITDDFVNELARIAKEEGRILAVMAVDMDSGRPRIFDLTAIAAGEGRFKDWPLQKRRDRIVDAIRASSAIPVAFEPVFIDKNMYVDGGARQHVFIGAELAVAAAGSKRLESRRPQTGLESYVLSGTGPRIHLHVLVNGDYRLNPGCTENSLFGVAERAFSVTVNQMLYDSVYRLLTLARGQSWEVRVADARAVTAGSAGSPGTCHRKKGEKDDQFSQPYMACLYEKACMFASAAPMPWKTSLEEALPRGFSLTVPSEPERCKVSAQSG